MSEKKPYLAIVVAVLALIVGAAIGYFIPKGGGPDVSEDGRITYACELIRDVDGKYETDEDFLNDEVGKFDAANDIMTAGALLGGQKRPTDIEGDAAAELGLKLVTAMQRWGSEENHLTQSIAETVEYCDGL